MMLEPFGRPEGGYVYESGPHRISLLRALGVRVLVTRGRVPSAPDATWIPEWAYAVCEATVIGAEREGALRVAIADEMFREAVLAAWLLCGFTAAAQLVGEALTSAGRQAGA